MVDDVIDRDSDVSYAQFRALANSMPNLAWMAHPDGWVFWYNQRWYDYTGTTPEEMAGWGWQSVHHPDALPGMLEKWTHAVSHGEFFEMIFPLRAGDGSYRQFLTRVEPLRENGVIVGWYGTNTDVTEQEQARERLQFLINELNHRVKNTLATIQLIAAQTFREMKPDSTKTFENRILALAAVHDVLTRENWRDALLSDVIASAITHCGKENFDISGPEVRVSPQTASNLSMTLHELCTNAIKHGALSVPGGRVSIVWSVERGRTGLQLNLRWEEHGGPPVSPPARKGFGLRLIERALAGDANSSIALRFEPGGLVFTAQLSLGVDVLA